MQTNEAIEVAIIRAAARLSSLTEALLTPAAIRAAMQQTATLQRQLIGLLALSDRA